MTLLRQIWILIRIFRFYTLFRHRRRNQTVNMNCKWFNALKIVFFIFLLNTKYLVLADEVLNEIADDDSDSLQIPEPDEAKMAKRSWRQLRTSWGKRSFDDLRQEQLRRSNQNYQNDDYLDNLRSLDYGPSRLQDFNLISDDDFDGPLPINKRAWKSINGAWGKRDWIRRNGGGSKREPGNWGNLKGLWGK
jgi:hypothetical protein